MTGLYFSHESVKLGSVAHLWPLKHKSGGWRVNFEDGLPTWLASWHWLLAGSSAGAIGWGSFSPHIGPCVGC